MMCTFFFQIFMSCFYPQISYIITHYRYSCYGAIYFREWLLSYNYDRTTGRL